MDKKPLVSVIIPAYNAEKTIESTIHSVLTQTYQHFEIIVVNDGSTDSTITVVKSIKDKRIRLYSQKNKGPSAARNFGVKKAKGKYIAFLDADDEFLPKYIETKLSVKKDFVLCSLCNRSDDYFKYAKRYSSSRISLLYNFMQTASNIFIKKELAVQYPFNSVLLRAQEYDFLIRILNFSDASFVYLPKRLLRYNDTRNSISYQLDENIRYHMIILNKHRKLYKKEILKKNLFLHYIYLYKKSRYKYTYLKSALKNASVKDIIWVIYAFILNGGKI